MRQVFLDTETTGLDHNLGHRIIEIAAVEVINRRITRNHFHIYLNPDREIDAGAQEVHGITLEFLQDKPRFADVMSDFVRFVADAELIIHNAPFDVGFLNAELGRCGHHLLEHCCGNIIDTLKMAKEMRPGQRNNLDALCRHFGVDNSKRTLHGALADALLLAECYLAMTRGQESLMMELEAPAAAAAAAAGLILDVSKLIVQSATPEELLSHEQYLDAMEKEIKGASVWRRILGSA